MDQAAVGSGCGCGEGRGDGDCGSDSDIDVDVDSGDSGPAGGGGGFGREGEVDVGVGVEIEDGGRGQSNRKGIAPHIDPSNRLGTLMGCRPTWWPAHQPSLVPRGESLVPIGRVDARGNGTAGDGGGRRRAVMAGRRLQSRRRGREGRLCEVVGGRRAKKAGDGADLHARPPLGPAPSMGARSPCAAPGAPPPCPGYRPSGGGHPPTAGSRVGWLRCPP